MHIINIYHRAPNITVQAERFTSVIISYSSNSSSGQELVHFHFLYLNFIQLLMVRPEIMLINDSRELQSTAN